MASRKSRVLIAAAGAVGALLGGCRATLPELEAAEPAPGDGVAFVRDVMIEAAKLADGPRRSEKAVQAVSRAVGEAEDED